LTKLESLARSAGLGRLKYRFYHAPKAKLRETAKRGFLRTVGMMRGRSAMMRAAQTLRFTSVPDTAPVVHYLSGRQFWFQTVFCYRSLRNAASDVSIGLAVYDDGTFNSGLLAQIRESVPGATIVKKEVIAARLDQALPRDRYPTLRRVRETYPNLRKLTDIHAGSAGWKLVLDSDMLFHQRPDELLFWLSNPSAPLCMRDVQRSYGYSGALMQSLVNRDVPDAINVGVCGLQSEAIDWDLLENWAATLLREEGMSYYLEQALIAMLFASGGTLLPASDYVVLPSADEMMTRRAKLHHYVADSRTEYLTSLWRPFTV
jgi:hypothetical protein